MPWYLLAALPTLLLAPCPCRYRDISSGSSLDLGVTDLEDAHDWQLERLAGELEHVYPLGHHDRTACCDVDDAELDALHARRTRANDRGEAIGNVRLAGDGLKRDVVVDGRWKAVQPTSRPFTVSLTSMLPRVALEYGHT